MFLRVTSLATAAVITATAAASAVEVEYDTIVCFSGETSVMVETEHYKSGTMSGAGASLPSDQGEVSTLHCAGVWHEIGERYEETGYCEDVDSAGDRTFGRYVEVVESGRFVGGTFEYLRGTGRLSGITGGGTFEPLADYPRVKSGEFQECVHSIGTYTLP